jgi:hypothetical protein
MSRAFFRRRSQPEPSPELKPGDSYCRHHGNRVTETATVLNLCSDLLGIPHVRFNVAFDRVDSGRFEGGLRMLSLESFVDVYRERVTCSAAGSARIETLGASAFE